MKEDIRSIQLSVRGKPSAFDLSHDGGVAVVASPGCMTFFDIDGLGVPKHYIYYEQQTQVRRIRYQKDGLLAALRGGAVSLWDPAHSLRPLLGFIQDSNWITNLEWGNHNAHLIATCCDGGDGNVWDSRSPYLPVQSIAVGGICQKISWSKYDSNYMALSNERKVNIIDSRMIGSRSTVASHYVPDGVIQFAWCAKDNDSMSMVVAGRDGSLSWLTSLETYATHNAHNTPQDAVSSSSVPGLVDDASLLFSTPVGRGAVVCRYEYIGNTQQAQPFLATSAAATKNPVGAINDTSAVSTKRTSYKIESMGSSRSDSRKVAVNLIGYPEGGEQAGSPASSDKCNSKILQLAQCPDPVVGVRWGNPGRLIPPMHSGQEMLFLSTSSCLHAVAISDETMNSHCSNSRSNNLAIGRMGADKQISQDKDHTHRGREEPLRQLAAPKFCLSGLKRYVVPSEHSTSQASLAGLSKRTSSGRGRTGAGDADDLTGSGLSMSGEYWAKLQDSVLLLQKKVQSGYLEGLSIDLVDKYARQITLYLERPDSAPFASTLSAPLAPTSITTGAGVAKTGSAVQAPTTDKAVHSGNAFSDFDAISSADTVGVNTGSGLGNNVTEGELESRKEIQTPEEDEMAASSMKKGRKIGGNSAGSTVTSTATAGIGGASGLTDKEKRLSDRIDRIERSKAKNAALIISFPPNYPQSGYPTFTLRSGGLASSSSSLRSDIIAELASIAKGSTIGAASAHGHEIRQQLTPTKLLFDVAECFRCRTLQYWGVKVNIPPVKSIALAPSAITNPSTNQGGQPCTNTSIPLSLQQPGHPSILSPNRIKESASSGDLGLDLDGTTCITPPSLVVGQVEGSGGAPVQSSEHTLDFTSGLGPEVGVGITLTPPNSYVNLQSNAEFERRQQRSSHSSGDVMYDGGDVDKALILGQGHDDNDKDGDESVPVEGAVAYSKATEVIDPLAYYVPCPASSGGFFAPSGALMTFGGAKFQIRVLSKSGGEGGDALSVQTDAVDNAINGSGEKNIADANMGGGNSSNYAQNLYPKSYADMLLRQREREFYESEKTAEDQNTRKQANAKTKGGSGGIAATPGGSGRKIRPVNTNGSLVNPRPIIKSSSGVFFVDQNLSSDSESGSDSTEDESHSSSSDNSSSSNGSDGNSTDSSDIDIDDDDAGNDSSFMANSVYMTPLFNADMDMEALSAHLDEEQVYLKRNPSSNSRSMNDVSEVSSHDEAKKKRFLVAEELQVSSQNPTVVEIYSRGFEVPQTLADEYVLGPPSIKSECRMNSIDSENQKQQYLLNINNIEKSRMKTVNALFAHMRAEPDGANNTTNSRFVKPSSGIGAIDGARVRSPSRGIAPMSRTAPPRGVESESIMNRLRSSSSYNDSLLAQEMKHGDKGDGNGMSAILFPSVMESGDEFDELPGVSQSYQGEPFKRTVSWAQSQGQQGKVIDGIADLSESTSPPRVDEFGAAQSQTLHQRALSNSLQQLPFSMADLDIYSDAHREDDTSDGGDIYDDYRADDFSFRRRSTGNGAEEDTHNNNQGSTATTAARNNTDTSSLGHGSEEDLRSVEPIIGDYRLSKILLRVDSCKYNAEIAASRGNVDAYQLWHLLSISLGTMAISVPLDPDEISSFPSGTSSRVAKGSKGSALVSRGPQTSWRDSAIGLLLLERVLSLCEQTGGVQTLATMICVLGGPSHVAVLLAADHPYFSSCSLKSMSARIVPSPEVRRIEVHYNGVLNAYCNVLHCWGRFITCTEISSRIDFLDCSAASNFGPTVHSHLSLSSLVSGDSGSAESREVDVSGGSSVVAPISSVSTMTIKLSCTTCSDYPLGTNYCFNCSSYSIRCGICQEGIRGAAIYCPECLHGGHVAHMTQWFGQMGEGYCPTGCGCECSTHLKPSEQAIDPNDNDSDDSMSDTSGPSRIMHHSSYSESSADGSGDSSSSEEEEEYRRSATSGHRRLFQKR